MAAPVAYTPDPYEQAYYDGLFQAADVHRAGYLGGQEAVAFFSRSKLPTDVLKNIWTVADQPVSNTLDRPKFYTAVRLIQLSQNGQKAQGAALAAPAGVTLRPVFFDGVSGVSVPMPPQAAAPPPQQQQPGPPPQQQQQQQPPMRSVTPTTMQQQPPMQQQQPSSPVHRPQPPPTPPRPPMQQQQPQQQPPAMSMALTTQDPYSMPPQEQARYEDIFAQYAKPDGYVYGPEAVALFSKSGLPQDTLRDIWNMVDSPVDNRLDKLEFAMAMHLIVCVSKKNLPMPPANSLPISLKQLKSQQQQQQPTASSQPPPPVMNAPAPSMATTTAPPPLQMAGSAGSVASAGGGMGGAAPQQPPQQQQQPPMMMGSSNMSVGSAGVGGPPPIVRDAAAPPAEIHAAPPPLRPQPAAAVGGTSISDAFEGLDGTGGGGFSGGPPPLTATSLPHPDSFVSASSFDHHQQQTIPEPEPAPAPPPAPPMEKPKTSKELASSYDMGDNTAELEKLKAMLQRLQAENISLKASLGSMTDEEREVQKEIGATVAEIGKLSNELTTLRAQVLAAKSSLLEATAELKGHHDKKAMITDLISETRATKDAIDAALDGVHEAEKMNEQPQMQAQTAPPSYEADLFGGFDAAPAPAAAMESVPEQQEAQPPPDVSTVSAATQEEEQQTNAAAQGMPYAPNEAYNPTPAPTYGVVETVKSSSDEEGGIGNELQHSVPNDGNPGVAGTTSAAEVEDIKEQSRQAEQTAKEAEETRRSLAQQADDLRKIAEQAESEVREKEAHTGHKKNLLRVGSKRKEMKQVEQAKQDAAEKKKQYQDMQTQANNAQALALETRREADRLRQEAEQKELELAQAASLAQSQPTEAPPQSQPTNGGGFGWAAPPQPQHHKQPSDYGGFGGGFGIMGGTANDGGWSIPSPTGSQNGDIANPY